VHKPWEQSVPPRKILVMRFQALGDLVITLPYLQDLKRKYPDATLHLLTREEVAAIPQAIVLFDKIIIIRGARNAKLQFIHALLLLPRLLLERYDMVLDLQNHRISKIIRRLLAPPSWVEFDRTSARSAGERTRISIEKCWDWKIRLDASFQIKADNAITILQENGWNGHPFVVLNPAGFCASRHWPIENYVAFAKLWLAQISPLSQFVLLLLPALHDKATYISKALGDRCINLTGKANQVEAFSVLQKSSFMLSEDSGLMHMAWVQGVPTLALFSSSNPVWSAPQGEHSRCLDATDMACGPCMLEVCKYGDNRCLTRYTPTFVLGEVKKIIAVA
jgi:heptosyltransferase II